MSPTTEQAYDFQEVTASELSRNYGRRRALRKVSLHLSSSEIVGLLGPNGSGKSTLLGVLATLVNPSSGFVRYGDLNPVGGELLLRTQIGFLSHEPQLYPELTARENLEFFARLYGLNDVPRRAGEALNLAGLETRGDDQVQSFSRGMRQRLALERTLLHDPRLVLLDEPFAGLDEASSQNLTARLFKLKRDGRIVLLATHDLDFVDGLIDRAVMLLDGRIVELAASGTSLRERYRQRLAST